MFRAFILALVAHGVGDSVIAESLDDLRRSGMSKEDVEAHKQNLESFKKDKADEPVDPNVQSSLDAQEDLKRRKGVLSGEISQKEADEADAAAAEGKVRTKSKREPSDLSPPEKVEFSKEIREGRLADPAVEATKDKTKSK